MFSANTYSINYLTNVTKSKKKKKKQETASLFYGFYHDCIMTYHDCKSKKRSHYHIPGECWIQMTLPLSMFKINKSKEIHALNIAQTNYIYSMQPKKLTLNRIWLFTAFSLGLSTCSTQSMQNLVLH